MFVVLLCWLCKSACCDCTLVVNSYTVVETDAAASYPLTASCLCVLLLVAAAVYWVSV